MHFFTFKTEKCIWVKRFYANTLVFFPLLVKASPLKAFYMSLYSTKNVKKT